MKCANISFLTFVRGPHLRPLRVQVHNIINASVDRCIGPVMYFTRSQQDG